MTRPLDEDADDLRREFAVPRRRCRECGMVGTHVFNCPERQDEDDDSQDSARGESCAFTNMSALLRR